MDLLDYTEEDLEKLDTETLLKLIEECEDKVKIYLSQQMSKKILINSLYGALANKGFSLFNEKIAQSITGNGRFFIQYSAIKIENKLQSILPSKNKYLVYGDTDSCVGDTIIETIRSKTKIEDFFNHTAGKVQVTPNGLIKKPYMNLLVKSMSDKFEVEFKTVKYIMKHSVEKRMFKIKTHEREVIITEDHSVIVNRNGEMLSVKPKDILKTDKLIFIEYFDDYDLSAEERKIFEQTTDFEIEDLGIQKQTVYDIEVEDNHNFFGNDILLHNSNYYHIGNIMAEIIKKNPNKTINEYVDLAIKFEEQFVDPTIQESIKEFAEMFNAHDVGAIGAKRELVADKCLFSKTTLNVQIDNKNVSIRIGELLNKFAPQGYNYRVRKPYFLDVSDKNIYIMTFNESTMKNEKKKILNIQKRLTNEQMVEIVNPKGSSIICTENHKIAVKVNNSIIWKCAKDINEDDDIVYNDNKMYSKDYCLEWNKNYINPTTNETIDQKKSEA